MNKTHTPGPWKVEMNKVFGLGGCYITRDVQNGENYICRMDGSTHAAMHQTSNARLIAAAPELLEALEGLIRNFVSEPDIHRDLKKAKIAIAKAKGEQNATHNN